jgi:hypothetical protein
MEIVNLFYFNIEESLSSSTVVGSLSYYLSSVLIFSITEIDANSNNFKKSTDSLSTVIGLPFHGRQNFRKLGYEIPAPRSPLPAPRSRTSFSQGYTVESTRWEAAQRIFLGLSFKQH